MALYENAIDYSAPGLVGAGEQPFIGGGGPMALLQNDPEFAAKLRAMPPEERQQFMRQVFQDYGGIESIIEDEQLAADELIDTQGPEGIYTKSGGYVAANPLQHIVSGVKQYQGRQQAKKALQRREDLSADRTGGVTSIAEELMRRMGQREPKRGPQLDIDSLGDELQDSPYRMA